MIKNVIIPALALLVACSANNSQTKEGTVEEDTGTHVQEMSATYDQPFEYLSTECGENNTIPLMYDEVIIISASHWTGANMREHIPGWAKDEETGQMMIAYCGENVEVLYMYR